MTTSTGRNPRVSNKVNDPPVWGAGDVLKALGRLFTPPRTPPVHVPAFTTEALADALGLTRVVLVSDRTKPEA